jgi:cytochrome c oxidase cbb3-type subunit 3
MFLFIVTGLIYLLAFPGLGNSRSAGLAELHQDVRSLAESKAAAASAKAEGRAVESIGNCQGRRDLRRQVPRADLSG